MVNCLVQVAPPFIECQIGANAPHAPEKALITISRWLARLMAIDGSPSLNVSVLVSVGSVLLTTTSRNKSCVSESASPPAAVLGATATPLAPVLGARAA